MSISVWLFLLVSPYSKTIKEQYHSCVLVVLVRIDGLWIQWAFHRVQEHPKRSSLLSSILILIFLPYIHLFIYVFTIHYYVFIIHYYVFTICYYVFHYSQLRIHYSLLHIHYYVFTITFTIHSHENTAKSRDFGTHA